MGADAGAGVGRGAGAEAGVGVGWGREVGRLGQGSAGQRRALDVHAHVTHRSATPDGTAWQGQGSSIMCVRTHTSIP